MPTRSTSNTRRASAIVGEMPAACARARNGPSSRTRATSASTAAGSATSHATPTAPSMAGAFTSTATNTSAVPRKLSTHARPMPLAAPVMTATVIDGLGDVLEPS